MITFISKISFFILVLFAISVSSRFAYALSFTSELIFNNIENSESLYLEEGRYEAKYDINDFIFKYTDLRTSDIVRASLYIYICDDVDIFDEPVEELIIGEWEYQEEDNSYYRDVRSQVFDNPESINLTFGDQDINIETPYIYLNQ